MNRCSIPGDDLMAEQSVDYGALKRHPKQVTIYVDGVACSVASLIAMGGETIAMAENSIPREDDE